MAFDLQPVLTGKHVHLRPLRAEDFPSLYAVASDPLIWEQHPARNRWQEEVFREFFRGAMASGGALLASDAVTGQVIGSSRFHGFDPLAREIEIGWSFLARSHWGGVWNREMKHLMLPHAFRFVDAVVFIIGSENIRSQRAVEKLGGIRLPEMRPDSTGQLRLVYQIAPGAMPPAE